VEKVPTPVTVPGSKRAADDASTIGSWRGFVNVRWGRWGVKEISRPLSFDFSSEVWSSARATVCRGQQEIHPKRPRGGI